MKRVFIFAAFLLIGAGPATKPVRQSGDGVPFPPAPEKVSPLGPLPIIGDRLGNLPEKMGTRIVWSDRAMKTLGTRGTMYIKQDWGCFGLFGTDLVGFSISDGVVSRIVLFYSQASEAKAKSIAAELGKSGKPEGNNFTFDGAVHVHASMVRNGGSLNVVFEADAVDWFLSHHEVAANVAAAMRDDRFVEGMTRDEALMLLNRPRSAMTDSDVEDRGNGTQVLVWKMFISSGLRTDPPHLARTVTLTFRDGMVSAVNDQR